MKSSLEKKQEFARQILEISGVKLSQSESDQILSASFELIKEGLINQAINCTLEGDMNSIFLEGVLSEPDWELQDGGN